MGTRRTGPSEGRAVEGKNGNLLRTQDSDSSVSSCIDSTLCDRLRAGDSMVLDTLMNALAHQLLRFAVAIVESKDMAEDIVQYVFINLWNRRTELYPGSNLRAYLFTAVRNRAINELSKESVRKRHLEASLPASHYKAGHYTADPGHEDDVFNRITVQAALNRLSERRQMAVRLRLENDLAHAEIAEIMGISTVAAKRLVARSLEELREILWEDDE